ncbi:hypothetical protein BD779DRAFT_1539897 [Infundibulicybe gibba]|nr:hypothetical protein BD779DRAFT_1539897 [Infundibulicybe gibba]
MHPPPSPPHPASYRASLSPGGTLKPLSNLLASVSNGLGQPDHSNASARSPRPRAARLSSVGATAARPPPAAWMHRPSPSSASGPSQRPWARLSWSASTTPVLSRCSEQARASATMAGAHVAKRCWC